MSTLNLILQTLHNLTRWVVIILAVIALVRAFSGWLGKKTYTSADARSGSLYAGLFDLQLLLGVILFFTKGWFGVLAADMGAAMSTASVRFFAVEHWLVMIVALIFAHVGVGAAKKAATDRLKFRRSALWFALSFLLMLAAIPWPSMAAARPLFRFFGLF